MANHGLFTTLLWAANGPGIHVLVHRNGGRLGPRNPQEGNSIHLDRRRQGAKELERLIMEL